MSYRSSKNGYSVQGLQNVIAKTKSAIDSFEEMYGGGVETAFVGSDSFLLIFMMDVKPTGHTLTESPLSGASKYNGDLHIILLFRLGEKVLF